jgi:hypothetical protein
MLSKDALIVLYHFLLGSNTRIPLQLLLHHNKTLPKLDFSCHFHFEIQPILTVQKE